MLSKGFLPSILIIALFNNAIAVPMVNSEALIRRDNIDDLIGDLISAAIEVLGPSAASELVPLESVIAGTVVSATDTTVSAEETGPSSVLTGSQAIVTAAPSLVTDTVDSAAIASTDLVTLPGGGVWFPGGYFDSVDPFYTVTMTESTSAVASASSASSDSVETIIGTPIDTASWTTPTAPPDKRDGNVITALFGGVISSIASEVLPLLPSADAAEISSITQKLFAATTSMSASSDPTGNAESAVIATTTSPAPSATHSNAAFANRMGLSRGLIAGAVVVICSIFLGGVIGL